MNDLGSVGITAVTRRALLIGCVLLGVSRLPTQAQEVTPAPGWMLTAECRMITVPEKLAFGLIEELSDDGTIDAAWKRVEEMITRGEIEAVAALLLRGNAGEALKSVSGEEVSYPTEFDPPEVPDTLPEKGGLEMMKAWPVIAITPTAFERRQAGQTFEVEASVSADGASMIAQIKVTDDRLVRWAKYDAGRLSDGERLTVEQPIFHKMENIGQIQIRSGQRLLFGVHRAPDPAVKAYELFILRILATPAGAKP